MRKKTFLKVLILFAYIIGIISVSWVISIVVYVFIEIRNLPEKNPSDRYNLSNFDPNISEDGIADNLIPVDFIDAFAYEDGYYHYYVYDKSPWLFDSSSRLLLCVEYDSEIYVQAKARVFEEMDLSEKAVKEYDGFVFYDNYGYRLAEYPRGWMVFAFNDSKNTLLFMGWYTTEQFDENIDEKTLDDIIPEYFGEWYDFSS